MHQALVRCLSFVVDAVGLGPHGIARLLTSDWDDSMHPPDAAYNVSESVLTGALASFALRRAADAFQLAGDSDAAAKAAHHAAANAAGIMAHAFNGQWLRRDWFGPDVGWLGDVSGKPEQYPGLFSAQQGWALAGGVFDHEPAAATAVIASLGAKCRGGGWRFGFPYFCDASTKGRPLPAGVPGSNVSSGSCVGGAYAACGAMWFAINHPTVIGLVAANATTLAWDEFERNSLDWQARTVPHLWPGIWTSTDQHHNDGDPGWGQGFPALCMHRHAWPLVSLRHLVGLHWDRHGLRVRPGLPQRLGRFEWSTGLASIAWDGVAVYSGTYTVGRAGKYRVLADLGLVEIVGAPFVLEVATPRVPNAWSRQTAAGDAGGAAAAAEVEVAAGATLAFTITVGYL